MRSSILAAILLLSGCGPDPMFVQTMRARLDATGPEWIRYVEMDQTLQPFQVEARKEGLRSWEAAVRKAEVDAGLREDDDATE